MAETQELLARVSAIEEVIAEHDADGGFMDSFLAARVDEIKNWRKSEAHIEKVHKIHRAEIQALRHLATDKKQIEEAVRTLEAKLAEKQKQLKSTEIRSAEITASYKPQMIELENLKKTLAAREEAVLAREEKVAQREERAKAFAGHLSSFTEMDS
jgi:uncharacterized protein (DUF3084 family)